MTLNIQLPESTVLKPRITVFGVGGAGGNATRNMIEQKLEGASFIIANTDAQALELASAEKRIQLGQNTTQGLGAGADPEIGAQAAQEAIEEIKGHLQGSNMVFITAGMGGGTGTGASPVIAAAARDMGILTVGVVTKPFHFEGPRRMRIAEEGIAQLQQNVDTLIVIPNQNLFRIANEKTTFAEAFNMADEVLHAGVRGVTDLMVMPGLINLDFADIRTVMSEMGKAMMGTGEAEGERRAQEAADAAISNPLLDNVSMKGARGVLINITGGSDMTLFEVDEAANRVREEVDPSANVIFGSTFNEDLQGKIRVSVVATGIDADDISAQVFSGSSASSHAPRQQQQVMTSRVAPSAAPAHQAQAQAPSSAVNHAPTSQQQQPADTSSAANEQVRRDNERTVQQIERDIDAAIKPATNAFAFEDTVNAINREYEKQRADQSEGSQGRAPSVAEAVSSSIEQSAREGVFIAPSPVEPESYASGGASSTINQPSDFGDDDQADPISRGSSGGLFSRMARGVAKSFQTSDDASGTQDEWKVSVEERKEPVLQTAGDEDASSEDLLDIPAFLRRNSN